MKHVGKILDQVAAQSSSGSKQICNTPSTTSEAAFSKDEKAKASLFFARIQTIYGTGRCGTLWESEEELKIMRREWARSLGQFSLDQLESIFTRLKGKLSEGDGAYRFPDIALILGLVNDPVKQRSHRVFPKGLPEPDWKKSQRQAAGKIASKTCVAVMNGTACFVEDKPIGEG
jgi:hypothetical protein